MFQTLLEKRRSIRKYHDRPVEPEKIQALMEAVLRSPSGKGIYPCHYVIVDDPEVLGKLAEAKPTGAAFVRDAPLGIVICADQQRSDTCIEDASIAAIILQLAAESLDLGSCWIHLRNRQHKDGRSSQDYVKELLGIPDTYMVLAVIACGYPAEAKPPHPTQDLKFGSVHRGTFGNRLF